jgi:hypothetical protein
MVAGIITQVPWHCGERNCPAGWHLGSYWVDDTSETGYTFDEFTDGDHEDVDDLPTPEEEATAWASYWQDVIETGEDQLRQLTISRVRKVKRVWQVVVADWTGNFDGLKLVQARRRGRGPWRKPQDLPADLLRYLLVDPEHDGGRYLLEGVHTLTSFVDMVKNDDACTMQKHDVMTQVKFLVTVEEKIPRSEKVVASERQQAAKDALTSLSTTSISAAS